MTSTQSHRNLNEIQLEATPIIEERRSALNGAVISIKYSKGKFLGKGGFARVYEFTCVETKKILAAKVVPKASLVKTRAKQKLMSEIRIHRSLEHTHVVRFDHFFEDSEYVYILLELCVNQTINEKIRRRKRLTEMEVQCYIMQILSGLRYLHKNKVIHRDLKLGNLFLSDKMELKLADFGLATKLEFDGEKKRTICGTPNYIAPEILEGKNGHSYEVDVWSLGVVIYTMLIGKPPFETNDVKTTYRKIRLNSYSFPENVPISNEAKSLVIKILHLNPSLRPSLDEILAHDFLHTGNTIPKVLPSSTLACAPSSNLLKQYGTTDKAYTTRNTLDDHASLNNANNDIQNKQHAATERQRSETDDLQLGGAKQLMPNTLRESSDKDKKDRGMRTLAVSMYNPNVLDLNGGEAADKGPDIWVMKWVDYSTKYGLGYLLSSGATGVFFNDSTKIVLKYESEQFDYMERKSLEKHDSSNEYTIKDYPKELHKKVTLLQHFKSYLDGMPYDLKPSEQNNIPVYIKKWMRTKHAIMFRLSNKIVQVNFQDHTEIILSSEARVVTYVNKRGRRSTHHLSTALESSNLEMSKRLKYTKDILTHMLTTGVNPKKNDV